jgi:hypothetical protein
MVQVALMKTDKPQAMFWDDVQSSQKQKINRNVCFRSKRGDCATLLRQTFDNNFGTASSITAQD